MLEQIAIGGFGGQGVLFIGRLLAEAAFREGHEVAFMPSYGAEKRGGTVWCHITVSDEKIGSLFFIRPTASIAMNPASLGKFEQAVKPDGLLLVNKSLVQATVKRTDIEVRSIPAMELAAKLGDAAASNLVVLGALLCRRPVVSFSSVRDVLENISRDRLEPNVKSLECGYRWAESETRRVRSGGDGDVQPPNTQGSKRRPEEVEAGGG